MKYYLIGRSDDLKTIGHDPQTTLKKGYNPRINGLYQVKHYEFPNFLPELKLELHKDAIPTDYLYSMVGFGMMTVSEKMKEVLQNHLLPKHHFYPIEVFHKKKTLKYFWLHFIVDDFWSLLDKEKSFGEIKEMTDPVTWAVKRKVSIESKEQIRKIQFPEEYVKNEILTIGQITMKEEFPKYDLYQIGCINHTSIISEKLKNALLEKGLTGFSLQPANKFKINQ
ncbi:imm11 family protein [Aquimarina algiphila]|uniref:DUF2971 domain-containing protein n=1 Tax=Aquimarina algiphila TaxID=2047982 RepID=A0A554VBD0_9FLAO|nr:DUF1629 domain-containing protein [Aquimarina algiphila]TSE03825.1 hypothetical protein FOF46_28385 [Aquimarina algiphila]